VAARIRGGLPCFLSSGDGIGHRDFAYSVQVCNALLETDLNILVAAACTGSLRQRLGSGADTAI